MSKILIYTVNPQSPHMETELELASKFKAQGDEVIIVRCTGQLRSCLVNPYHNFLICAACKAKYDMALNSANLKDVKIRTLPPIKQSYDFLPKVFRSIEELKAFRFKDFDAGIAVSSTLIGRLNKDHKFDTVKYQAEVRREMEMYVDLVLRLEQILNDINPDEVYFFNGRFSLYHPLKALCLKRNIIFYTHERAGVINKYILRKNTMPHSIDYTIKEINKVWDEAGVDREAIGSKFFNDRRNNVIQSWLSFTEAQRKGSLPAGFNPEKRNIVIFNSTMEEYEGMEEWKNPIYADDNDGIQKILESFKDNKSFIFYLRVHPNLKLLKNTQLSEIYRLAVDYDNLYVIRPEETYDSYALMDSADKVITFGSTIGSEATYWGKPSILLGKSMYGNIDACYEPKTHEDTVQLILREDLPPKQKINAIKYGYWELTKGVFFEYFKQVDLFKMEYNGRLIQPPIWLRILEKLPKLWLLKNARDVENVKNKFKNILKWR